MGPQPYLSLARLYVIAQAVDRLYQSFQRKKEESEALLGVSASTVEGWRKGRRPVPLDRMVVLYDLTRQRVFLLTAREKKAYGQMGRGEVLKNDNWPDLPEEEAKAQVASVEIPRDFALGRQKRERGVTHVADGRQVEVTSPEVRAAARPSKKDGQVFLTFFIGMLRQVVELVQEDQGLLDAFRQSEEVQELLSTLLVRHESQASKEDTRLDQMRIQLESLTSRLNEVARRPSTDPERRWTRKNLLPAAMKLFAAIKVLELRFPEAFKDLVNKLDVATQVTGGKSGKR